MKTIRGILIDPFTRTVSEVQLPAGKDFNTEAHKAMDCEIYTIAAHLPGGDIMLVDDEGLLKEPKPDHFFHTTYYPGPLAGKALIVGNTRGGSTADAKTKLGFDVLWMDRKDTRVFQEGQQRMAEKMRKHPGVIHVTTMKDVLGDD